MMSPVKIVEFIRYAEGLKTELRHASKSNGMRESVADHCWSLSLLIILVAPGLSVDVDLLKILKMAIIHDLVEIEANDVPILHHIANDELSSSKNEREKQAMVSIRRMLGEHGDEIHDLWHEFEALESNEARVLKALDRIEGQVQFLNENVSTFTAADQPAIQKLIDETLAFADVDPFIAEVYAAVLPQLRERIRPKN